MTSEQQKTWAELEMREYDRLPPEMRAAVQEYGDLPWDAYQPVAEYVAERQRRQRAEHIFLYPGLTDYLEPAT